MWIPGYEQRYYNPTRNIIPGTILGTHFAYALDEARGNFGPDVSRSDDVATPMLNLKPRMASVPVLPVQQMTILEAQSKAKAAKAAKK